MTLVFSSQQISAFRRAAIDSFVPDAVDYLDQALGDNTRFYGKEAVIDTIHYGIERAESYGIVGRHDVCLYLRLMFSLMGSDFDRDPLYPWAADILNDTYNPPNDKIMLLINQADEFLENIRQHESQYLKKVISATRYNPFTGLQGAAGTLGIGEVVFSEIKHAFPAKVACIGEDNVRRLIAQGLNDARTQGLQAGADIAAFVYFMFIYGMRFYSDPKYPQARLIFSNPKATGTEKIASMFAAARGFLLRKIELFKTR